MKKILLLAGFGICFLQAMTGPKEEKDKGIKIEFTIKNDSPGQITINPRTGGKVLDSGATLSLSYVERARLEFFLGKDTLLVTVVPMDRLLSARPYVYDIKKYLYFYEGSSSFPTDSLTVLSDESIFVTIRFYQENDEVKFDVQTKVQGPLKSLFNLALEPTIKQIKQNTLSLQQLKEKVPDEVYKSVIAEISRQMGVENWARERFYLLQLSDGRKEFIERNTVQGGKPSSKEIYRLSYPDFKDGVILYFTDIEKAYQKKNMKAINGKRF